MALNSLGIQIEAHWREFRPKMVKALERTGQLQAALEAAEEQTLTAECLAVQAGMTPDMARERFREEWAFLPSEADVPDLASRPQPSEQSRARLPGLLATKPSIEKR